MNCSIENEEKKKESRLDSFHSLNQNDCPYSQMSFSIVSILAKTTKANAEAKPPVLVPKSQSPRKIMNDFTYALSLWWKIWKSYMNWHVFTELNWYGYLMFKNSQVMNVMTKKHLIFHSVQCQSSFILA